VRLSPDAATLRRIEEDAARGTAELWRLEQDAVRDVRVCQAKRKQCEGDLADLRRGEAAEARAAEAGASAAGAAQAGADGWPTWLVIGIGVVAAGLGVVVGVEGCRALHCGP